MLTNQESQFRHHSGEGGFPEAEKSGKPAILAIGSPANMGLFEIYAGYGEGDIFHNVSSEDALRHLEEKKDYDVVLMSWYIAPRLEGGSRVVREVIGRELTEEIHRLHPQLSIGLLSGDSSALPSNKELSEMGVKEVLIAPFQKEDVAHFLDRILQLVDNAKNPPEDKP